MSVGERGYTEGIHQAIAPNETLCTTMVVSDIHRRLSRPRFKLVFRIYIVFFSISRP